MREFSVRRAVPAGALALVLGAAAPALAETITKPMSWTPPSGKEPGPIEGTTAVLEKGAFGAAMAIKSSGLTPGDVVTIWWVAVQNHENCAANPCTPKEAMGDGMANDTVAKLAAGGVVAEDGTISLASFLPVGEVDGNFYDTTFHSPETAEYHLPMHNHGPLDPEIAEDMLSSFRAGCTDESLPSYYPESAISDGVEGGFTCKTVQAALFPQAE
ncbi:MAG: hypothetical protein AAF871_17050 [Pseudomonadota bacterium]